MFALGVVGFAVLWATVDLPDETPMPQSAVIVTEAGEELAVVAPDGLRFEVGLDDVSPIAVQAVLAAEDRHFYSHGGIDPIGIARALWQNLRSDATQGGSTITQQLVKLTYTNGERSFTRKLREAILAIKLDRTADKDEILERYLNTVYFGRGAYGIEAAAQAYFGVARRRPRPAQAALARRPDPSRPRRPTRSSTPTRPPGAGAPCSTPSSTRGDHQPRPTADAADAVAARAVPIRGRSLHRGRRARTSSTACGRRRSPSLGEEAVYGDGLRIVTTLDLGQQRPPRRPSPRS